MKDKHFFLNFSNIKVFQIIISSVGFLVSLFFLIDIGFFEYGFMLVLFLLLLISAMVNKKR